MAKKKKRGNPAWEKGKSANPATQFQPGQTGNPGGYSSKARMRDAYRKLLELPPSKLKDDPKDDTATRLCKRIIRKAIKQGNIAAATEIANRAEGKAPQPIDVGFDGQDPLAELIGEFRKEYEKSSG